MSELEFLRGIGMMAEVAVETGVSMRALQEPTVAPNAPDRAHGARRLFAQRMRKLGASWQHIGQLLQRHHTTVMHMAGALGRQQDKDSAGLESRVSTATRPLRTGADNGAEAVGVTPPRAAVPPPKQETASPPVTPPPVGRWGS